MSLSNPPRQQDAQANRTGFKLLILPVLLYAVMCIIGLMHHEMWRDELRSWVLAQQSASLVDLFAQINNEGHPAIWYLCLYALQRFSNNLLAMQLFHGAIATAVIYLIHRFSPFSLLQRWLLTFNYFFFYEYAIVSRGYGLGILFLLAFCSLLSRPKWNLTLLAGALALLANTSVYGLMLSGCFALVWVWAWAQQKSYNSPKQQLRQGLGGLLILGCGWLISGFQVTRIVTAEVQRNLERAAVLVASNGNGIPIIPSHHSDEAIERFIKSLIQVWKAYVPVPLLGQSGFWNTNFISNSELLNFNERFPVGYGFSALLSILMVILALRALWRSRLAVWVYCLGTTTLLLFSYRFAWWATMRHYGHLFILLMACFWLLLLQPNQSSARFNQANGSQPKSKRRHQSRFFTTLLVVQVFASLYFYVGDLAMPFSGSKALAAYVNANGLSELAIVGKGERQTASIAAYLDKPLYYPETQNWGKTWDPTAPREWDLTKQLEHVAALAEQSSGDVLLVWSEPLEQEIPGYEYKALETFPANVMKDESFYLYRLHQP